MKKIILSFVISITLLLCLILPSACSKKVEDVSPSKNLTNNEIVKSNIKVSNKNTLSKGTGFTSLSIPENERSLTGIVEQEKTETFQYSSGGQSYTGNVYVSTDLEGGVIEVSISSSFFTNSGKTVTQAEQYLREILVLEDGGVDCDKICYRLYPGRRARGAYIMCRIYCFIFG